MAKGQGVGEKSKEIHVKEHHENEQKDKSSGKSQGALRGFGNCTAVGCKASAVRFNFCEEHFDHFKFGLINKSGDHVPDYEKKFEQYAAHKAAAKGLKKAA